MASTQIMQQLPHVSIPDESESLATAEQNTSQATQRWADCGLSDSSDDLNEEVGNFDAHPVHEQHVPSRQAPVKPTPTHQKPSLQKA